MGAKAKFCWIFVVVLSIESFANASQLENGSSMDTEDGVSEKEAKLTRMRYLLYEVNPGEGFNLRRDVYMRMANMVKLLNEHEPWTLVLPPWGRIYHWKSRWLDQSKIRWSNFFDLESLNKHVPVVEFEDYFLHFKEKGSSLTIEQAYYLQRYEEGWKDGKWETRVDNRPCLDKTQFAKDDQERWRWWFWGYEDNLHVRSFDCLSVQMEYSDFVSFLLHNTTAESVLLLRTEHLSHGRQSNWSPKYWTARRSMRFAKHLRDVGDEFRRKYLDSTDEHDNTVLETDWTKMKREHGYAHGGPYIAAHLRRQDFARAHSNDVPNLNNTAEQLREILIEQNLNTVFIATDAPKKEYEELKGYLHDYKVVRYEPTEDEHMEYMDGGVAVVDQWICAHARHFIGTSVSTFTFRIHEEREILGFAQDTTYNRLCGDEQGKDCEQPAKWECKYE